MSDDRQENQGEGNITAAKEYNEKARQFIEHENVEQHARAAREALEGEEGKALREAEEQGRKHAHEEDPQIERKR